MYGEVMTHLTSHLAITGELFVVQDSLITWEDWKMQELDQLSYTHQIGGKHKLLETRVVIIIAHI